MRRNSFGDYFAIAALQTINSDDSTSAFIADFACVELHLVVEAGGGQHFQMQ